MKNKYEMTPGTKETQQSIPATSMVMYSAAGLIDYVPDRVKKYVVDPKKPEILHVPNLEFIADKASIGLERVRKMLFDTLR